MDSITDGQIILNNDTLLLTRRVISLYKLTGPVWAISVLLNKHKLVVSSFYMIEARGIHFSTNISHFILCSSGY
jgi:hypothetical protein